MDIYSLVGFDASFPGLDSSANGEGTEMEAKKRDVELLEGLMIGETGIILPKSGLAFKEVTNRSLPPKTQQFICQLTH